MKTLAHSHKEQGKDTLPAWVEKSVIKQARGHTLAGNPAAVPPSGSKVNAVGGSVIPANGRPDFLSTWLVRLAEGFSVTRPATRRTAVELGGGRI